MGRVVGLTWVFVAILASTGWAQVTRRASVASDGAEGNGASNFASVSADGRYLAFYSAASNLVPGDTNGFIDVFVRDQQTGTIELVSFDSGGTQGNGDSYLPVISADGRYVAFYSYASNLVPGDTNGVKDVFVRDRQSGTTVRASVDSGGTQGNGDSENPSISADGRYVAFETPSSNLVAGDTNGARDVFVRDLQLGTTVRVSLGMGGAQGNDFSVYCSISADGRYVAFRSFASNLVPGDTNGVDDVFVRDRQLNTTERVSLTWAGGEGNNPSFSPSISADGRYVAFESNATNLVPGGSNGYRHIFVRDRQGTTTEQASVDSSGVEGNNDSYSASISADGRCVAYESLASNLVAGDGNGFQDVFLRDRQSATTERASVSSGGSGGNGASSFASVSADGRFVAFESNASNFAGDTNGVFDVFLRDRLVPVQTQVTQRVSVDSSEAQGNGGSYYSSISADGRYVAFYGDASNLVSGDTNGTYDVFVRDSQSGTTERLSVDSAGTQGNSGSGLPSISADGRYVAFPSDASNLVSGDTNGTADVFVHDRQSGTTERLSVDSAGTQGNSFSTNRVSVSADGRYVAFESNASNLVSGDTNGTSDIFVRDRQSGTTERVSVDSAGTQGNNFSDLPSISADGRYVAFESNASNLVSGDTNGRYDVFVRDRQSGTTERVSVDSGGVQGDDHSDYPSISADGRYVAFFSISNNLVSGDTNVTWDVFVRDRQSGTTERMSVDSGGAQGNFDSYFPSISADGRYVAFWSNASTLVSGDTNGTADVFVHDRQSGTTERVSVDSAGTQGNSNSSDRVSVSADGRYVAFASSASNLVSGDTNGTYDVFVHDREATSFTSQCDPGTGGVIACPCSNPPSTSGRGCNNSAATGGAILSASGATYLTMDTLVFTTSGELSTALSIVLQGTATVSSGQVFGRGVRCVGGVLRPLFTKTASGGSITAPDFGAGDPSVSARSAALGDAIQAGQSRWYSAYYRDPIALCPVPLTAIRLQTFNTTQTGRVDWSL